MKKPSRIKERSDRTHSFVDLFAGCGGLSLGMEQAGFTPVFANEIWDAAAESYRKNRNMSEDEVFVGDIKYIYDDHKKRNITGRAG